MTLTGGMLVKPGLTNVDSIGFSSHDGWTPVFTLPSAKLNPNGTIPTPTKFAFMVYGKLGNVRVTNQGSPIRATVEVALGDTRGSINPFFIHRFELNDATLQAFWTGMPFAFQALVAGLGGTLSDPLWGNDWNYANDLQVVARIAANGSLGTLGSFSVADLIVLWWDLAALGAGNYFAEDYQPSSPVVNNRSGQGLQSIHQTTAFGTTGEKWLVFSNALYRPVSPQGPAFIRHGYTPDGTFASLVTALGGDVWGMSPNGRGSADGALVQYHHGGFWPLTIPSSNTSWAWQGEDKHNDVGNETRIVRLRVFAVLLDQLYQPNSITAPSVPALTGSWGDTSVLRPFEVQIVAPTNYAVLRHGVVPELGSSVGAYDQYVGTNSKNRLLWTPLLNCLARPLEGVPLISATLEGIGARGSRDVRYETYWWERPGYNASRFEVQDLCDVGFFFETDPSNIADAMPAVKPAIILRPGKEAPDPGTLLALPIEPEIVGEVELIDPLIEFAAFAGYVRTWPMMTGPGRRRRPIGWVSLERSDRDLLLAFFRANLFFKWAEPGAVERVWVATERPRAPETDPNRLFSLDLRILELVHVGT